MPLGKLSKIQIAKGFEVLEELEDALKKKSKKKVLEDLSSKFYTVIPQSFGRVRPPTIDTEETLQKKYDMLSVSKTF
jgi:poly [ADP-ribose] polymerase